MRKIYFFSLIFTLGGFAFSSTYLKTLVNDNEQSTMVQGDVFAWEYDVSVNGGSALFSIYLDIDEDETLSEADILIVEFEQTDGVADEDGPPPDQSGEDGIITTSLGHFGFAPARYIMHVTDLNDNSEASAPLFIQALSDVKIWAVGTLTKEDVTSPDTSLANIMIFSEPDNMNMGFWSGLTDSEGNYTINYPDSASDALWKISIEFDNMIAGYIPSPDSYQDLNLSLGENGPYDFLLERPDTYVYGKVYDEQMNIVNVHDYVNLVNLNSSQETDTEIIEGSFTIPAVFEGSDTTDVPFRLDLWGIGLIPNYLIPITWDNPYYRFYLSMGDSVEKNFYVYSTDTVIYVVLTQEGGTPSQSYTFNAQNDSLGRTWSDSDPEGFASLSVCSNAQYSVWIDTEEDGQSLLPEGYIIKDGPSRLAEPGDTVRFEIIPALSLLRGRLIVPDDQVSLFDPQDAEVQLLDNQWNYLSNYPIGQDSFKFEIPTGNGGFYVKFNHYNNDFLGFPAALYVNVHNDTIDTLHFDISYTSSTIHVRIINGPPDLLQKYSWLDITSSGDYPNVFQSFAQVFEDSTYHFRVCPAEWVIYPPYLGEEYQPISKDTVISVNADTSDYYVEFVYKNMTGIVSENPIPQKFYVLQNYPNPFNPLTTIPIGLPSKMHVQIDIYNLAGQRVAQVLDSDLAAGAHNITFDGSNLASGLYFYRVVTPQSVVTKKLILIK